MDTQAGRTTFEYALSHLVLQLTVKVATHLREPVVYQLYHSVATARILVREPFRRSQNGFSESVPRPSPTKTTLPLRISITRVRY
jgi:hypothetical protein